MHSIYNSWQPIKFIWISFNISEPVGKMIFPQFSLLQLWRHITFICISRWLPPYHKFLHFECKYLENQRWYWKTVNGILSILSDLTSENNMFFGWTFPLSIDLYVPACWYQIAFTLGTNHYSSNEEVPCFELSTQFFPHLASANNFFCKFLSCKQFCLAGLNQEFFIKYDFYKLNWL